MSYEYTLTANGCTNIQNVVVPVKPEPVISDQSITVCSGETVDHEILLDNFSNPGDNVTFTWPDPVRDPGLTGGAARSVPSSANLSAVFVNTSGMGLTATYTVTPYYDGCAGDPRVILVTIGSEPVLDPNLDMDACSDLPIGLELKEDTGSVVPTWYNITNIVVGGGLIGNGANNAVPANNVDFDYLSGHRFLNETGSDKTVTYTVAPYYGTACAGAPVDVVVTIKPQPVVTPASQAICSGTVPTLTLASNVTGSDFKWEVVDVDGVSGTVIGDNGTGDQFTATLTNLSFVLQGSVTYEVIGISPDGCEGKPVPIVITVNPLPNTSEITGEADFFCEGVTNKVFEVDINPGSTYDWTLSSGVGVKKPFGGTINDGYIIYDFPVNGDHFIKVRETNMYGCEGDLKELDIYVSPKPTAAVIAGPADVCEGTENVPFEVPLTTNSEYIWYVPSGAVITSGSEGPDNSIITVTFGASSGNIRVREVNEFGCAGPENQWMVTVNQLPEVYNVSGGGEYCEGAPGVLVGLDDSEAGVDYELYLNDAPFGTPVIV
ncbi:MAG: hypothetical protein LC655_05685, partial [Bacteroidales bacterium]|nr:hypothetical protein [Bacteroidales bacterium]